MGMESMVLTITPDMAKTMLAQNMKNNRRLNVETVKRYARIMKAGGWSLTHQGIAFDEDGMLIDGQHRLNAIVQANIPVKMMATYNVEHKQGEVFTIDAGRKRTTLNVMQISGIDDVVYKTMSSFIACYMRWKMPACRKAEPVEIIEYIDRHYDDIKKLYEITRPDLGNGQNNRVPAIVGAALLAAIYRGEDDNALFRFCEVYRRNDVFGCENYNPRHALNVRDYVRDHRYCSELYNRCESAIYAFCHNRSALHVRDNIYPYDAGMDA